MCEFTILLPIQAADAVAKAKSAIEKNSGTFSGDVSAGNFDISLPIVGTIKGEYTIDDSNQMTVVITKKPFMISCDRIQSEMEKYVQPEAPIV